MVIVDTTQLGTPEEYVRSLSERARSEFKLVHKRNPHVVYREAEFNKDQIHEFMQLWERQLVRGMPIQWAYPVETVCEWYDKGQLLLLEAVENDKTIAIHFLKKENGYWQAEPPMWDKENMKDRHVGTYMWFHMVLWGIEHNLGIINFGGGIDEWREMIKRRKEFRNPLYKWRFIPEHVKKNPDLQPDYKIIDKTLYGNI